MKTTVLVLGLALLLNACTSPPARSPKLWSPNLTGAAPVTTETLAAIHRLLLASRATTPALADYRDDCYQAKPLTIEYRAPDGSLNIHLQLFTHGTAPLPADSYPVAILGQRYDILGALTGTSNAPAHLVAAIAKLLWTTPAN